MDRVADIDESIGGEKHSISRISGGHHAIEHDDPPIDGLDHVFWKTDPHQVARFLLRKPLSTVRGNVIGKLHVFADGNTPDGKAVETAWRDDFFYLVLLTSYFEQPFQAFPPQILKHPPLHDGKEGGLGFS